MATYSLRVNGSVVANNALGVTAATLVSFERNYDDPAELVFRVLGDWRNPPYPGDARVTLQVDGAVVFEGLAYLPKPVLSTHEYPAMEYIAYDRSRALRGPSAMNDAGYPEIQLGGGTLGGVAAQYFALAAELLDAAGVHATAEFMDGADGVTCLPISLSGETVDEAVRQIASAAPGVRVFMAPAAAINEKPRYRFVRLMQSQVRDVTIDASRVLSLDIQPSVEGQCGAVRTLGGQTLGTADVETEEDEPLTPAWDPADEADWSIRDAAQLTLNGAAKDPNRAAVYRAYTWERDDITVGMIRRALIRVVDEPNPLDAIWQERKIESIIVPEKTVILKRPAIAPYHIRNKLQHLNPAERGRAVGVPAKLRLRNSGTATTPIYIASYRVPETGFAGRAYAMMPITCGFVKTITVPGGVNHEQYAQDAFDALSEPIVDGSLPLDEGLPADLWLLARRINIRTGSNGATGYEDLRAPMLGVSHQWASGETATLQFSRDDTVALAGGSQ